MQDQPYQADMDASTGMDARDAGPAAAPPASSGKVGEGSLSQANHVVAGPLNCQSGPSTPYRAHVSLWLMNNQRSRRSKKARTGPAEDEEHGPSSNLEEPQVMVSRWFHFDWFSSRPHIVFATS
jgi:hypothetical protein